MKAAAFTYHRPGTVAEAVQMLGEFGEDAKILAGGQSLVPMLAMRLTYFETFDRHLPNRRTEEHRTVR